MTTDTTEKGLEPPITRHLTGTDGLAVAPNMVAGRPPPSGGTSYTAGSAHVDHPPARLQPARPDPRYLRGGLRGSTRRGWPKLPKPKEEDLAKGILEAIDMDSYRVEKEAAMMIALADHDAMIEPVPTDAGCGTSEPELDWLSNILKPFNEQFGTLFILRRPAAWS